MICDEPSAVFFDVEQPESKSAQTSAVIALIGALLMVARTPLR